MNTQKTTKQRNTALEISSQTKCLVMYRLVERRMKRKKRRRKNSQLFFSSCCSHGKKEDCNSRRVSDHITRQGPWREIVEEQCSQRRLYQSGMSEITK